MHAKETTHFYTYHRGYNVKPWRFDSLEGAKRRLPALEPGWDVTKLHACRQDWTRGLRFEDHTPIRRVIKKLNRMLVRLGHTREELWSYHGHWENPLTRDSTMGDLRGRWALFAVEGASEGFYAHWDVLRYSEEKRVVEVFTVALSKWFCNDHATIYQMVSDTATLLRV